MTRDRGLKRSASTLCLGGCEFEHRVKTKDIKNGSNCFYVRCATSIESVEVCLGPKQAQLIIMHVRQRSWGVTPFRKREISFP